MAHTYNKILIALRLKFKWNWASYIWPAKSGNPTQDLYFFLGGGFTPRFSLIRHWQSSREIMWTLESTVLLGFKS